LRQDFSGRLHASREFRQRANRVNASDDGMLWQRVKNILSMKAFYLPAIAGLFISLLILSLPSHRVDASVSLAHEEWLAPELNVLDSHPISVTATVEAGDVAISVLAKLGFPFAEVMAMQQSSKKIHSLTSIQVGHRFWRKDKGDTTHVFYNIDGAQRLHLKRDQDGWQTEIQAVVMQARQRDVSATISDSLFLAASAAGLSDRTTMNLVDIFAWDIDFARDLRAGDHFRVIYDELYNEAGKQVGATILAAEFVNQGHTYHAIRYELANGKTDYFSLDGKSLRKTYLKAPVKYSRISSGFKTSRKHPVLGYTRAHKGVDYAAKTGTPIRAIGDGRIAFSSWKGGYGRLVEIRHGNRNHSTRYGHLSKFGRGIHKGVHVEQGQIIGYVGMSGLATGPHLHFEFRVRGRAVNPLTVKHDPAKPIPDSEMTAFHQQVEQFKQQLEWGNKQDEWG